MTASQAPERIALIAPHGLVTYRELSESIQSVSRSLLTNRSKSCSSIAVIAQKNIFTVECILGAIDASVVVVPINPLLKSAQISHILHDSQASTFVCDRYTLNAIQNLPPNIESVIITNDPHTSTVLNEKKQYRDESTYSQSASNQKKKQ